MNWEGGSCNWSKGRPDRHLPTNGLARNGWPGLATGPRLGQTAIYRLMDWPKMVGPRSCNWPKARPDRHRYRDPKPSPSIISVIISSINIVVAQPTRRHPLSEQRNRQRAPLYREALRPEDGKRVREAVHWDNRRPNHLVVSIW